MQCRRETHVRRILTVLLLTVLLGLRGEAQETDAETPQAPLVSRIRLSVRDPQIRISWEEPGKPVEEYRVYRAGQPITGLSLHEALQVGTVRAGERAHIDTPAKPGTYYYAVVAVDPDGAAYEIIVADRNATYRPVTITSTATQAERAARVERIEWTLATMDGRTVIEIRVVADREGRSIAVYRSTSPLASLRDLEQKAALVREVDSGTAFLTDLPVPGVEYYYAALDTELLLAGGGTIRPGENATTDPAEIPLEVHAQTPGPLQPGPPRATEPAEAVEPAMTGPPAAEAAEPERAAAAPVRPLPLPLLHLESRLSTGRRLHDPRILIPQRASVDRETEQSVSTLLERMGERRRERPAPTVLPEDRLPDPRGAEYTLRTILDGPFRRWAWEEAIVQLGNYFTLPLTPDLAARAHFYRAQAYYFTGERQRAILEFLLARDHYYVEVRAWLDHLLAAAR